MTVKEFQNEILPLKNRLYRYALSMVYREELAKDIVQEVFLKVWERRMEMPEVRNKEAWCMRSTRNLALDKLKAHSNKVQDLQTVLEQKSSSARPDHISETEDLLNSTKRLMEMLPEKQREIFRLKELMGYSNQEIEDLLDLNTSQVKVSLFRARKKIRESLRKLVNYGLPKN